MNKTIELPSGKIIDLNRFVALMPDEKETDNTYSLILEGCEKAIALDAQEAISVKELLFVLLIFLFYHKEFDQGNCIKWVGRKMGK